MRTVRDELTAEQAAKADVISKLESETAARKEEELKVVSLQAELQDARNSITELESRLESVTLELSATKKALAVEKELSERQLAELRDSMARLAEEHAAAVQRLQDQVAHEKELAGVALEAASGIVSQHDYDPESSCAGWVGCSYWSHGMPGAWWNVTNDPPPEGRGMMASPLWAFTKHRALNRLALRTKLDIQEASGSRTSDATAVT